MKHIIMLRKNRGQLIKHCLQITDIEVGTFIIRAAPGDVTPRDPGGMACITYKIGWHASSNKMALISALTDGMVLAYDNKEDILNSLKRDYAWRVLSKKELAHIITERAKKCT